MDSKPPKPLTIVLYCIVLQSENIGSVELTFQFISALQNHTEDRFSIQIWLKYRHEKTLKKTFSRRRPGSYFQSIYFSLSLSCLTDISTYPFFVPSDPEWTAENRENIFYSNGAQTSQIKKHQKYYHPISGLAMTISIQQHITAITINHFCVASCVV